MLTWLYRRADWMKKDCSIYDQGVFRKKLHRSLLLHAFAIDILEHIKPEPIREYVDKLISERLEFDVS